MLLGHWFSYGVMGVLRGFSCCYDLRMLFAYRAICVGGFVGSRWFEGFERTFFLTGLLCGAFVSLTCLLGLVPS